MRSFQVSCSKKRGTHRELPAQFYKAHERIEGLGGTHDGYHWYLSETLILAELQKPESERRTDYYVTVHNKVVHVILATYNGRIYLKTTLDDYAPDTLLTLPDCPRANP